MVFKFIYSLVVLICLAACSFSDQGVKLTDELNKNSKMTVDDTQADIVMTCHQGPKISTQYSSETEERINQLYKLYVTGEGVKYLAWLSDNQSIKGLCHVVNEISNTDYIKLSFDQQKSFFINAYNVFTIHLILYEYLSLDGGEDAERTNLPEKKSIQNLVAKGELSTWDVFKWKINGTTFSLKRY